MKDFHDLILLLRNKRLQISQKLHENVKNTFDNRGTALNLIQFDEVGCKALQKLWIAHLDGLGDVAEELNLPKNIEIIIDTINLGIKSISVEL